MRPTLEEPLFEWSYWDGRENAQGYTGCVLQKQIGQFEAGRRIPHILLDIDRSILVLTDQNGIKHPFELYAVVGKPLAEVPL